MIKSETQRRRALRRNISAVAVFCCLGLFGLGLLMLGLGETPRQCAAGAFLAVASLIVGWIEAAFLD